MHCVFGRTVIELGGGIFRKSRTQRNPETFVRWSKAQTNMARSSGDAELNSAVKGISKGTGVRNAIRELR